MLDYWLIILNTVLCFVSANLLETRVLPDPLQLGSIQHTRETAFLEDRLYFRLCGGPRTYFRTGPHYRMH